MYYANFPLIYNATHKHTLVQIHKWSVLMHWRRCGDLLKCFHLSYSMILKMDIYLRKINANLELMWRLIQPLPTGKSSLLMRIFVIPNSSLVSRISRCWMNISISCLIHFQWEEIHGEFINIHLCVCAHVWYNTCLIFFSRVLRFIRKCFSTLDDKWISIFLHLADNERLLPDERIYTRGHFRVLDPYGSNHITEKCT